jgi:hypothetical protein
MVGQSDAGQPLLLGLQGKLLRRERAVGEIRVQM